MDIFDLLNMIGGLSLFLFGMNVMSSSLEHRAGNKLKPLLSRLTTGRLAGLLTGTVITAAVQSSSATAVMTVGFVDSGVMTLSQAVNVIMGANIGTTVTPWVLSLTGIKGDSVLLTLLRPSTFVPITAAVGTVMLLSSKRQTRKDSAAVLLGFATLMYGMEQMSQAVSGLSEIPQFQNVLTVFSNPVAGVLAGAVLTAIVQSSSASVGILQTLAMTGKINAAAAVPIVMGQNIGTCVTALISSVGTQKNAKRAALVHLLFNLIGTAVCLVLFCLSEYLLFPGVFQKSINAVDIAAIHTLFNLACTVILFPSARLLERLAVRISKN